MTVTNNDVTIKLFNVTAIMVLQINLQQSQQVGSREGRE